MTDSQEDKFSFLSESIDYSDEDTYRQKLKDIKESYFRQTSTRKYNLIDDEDPIDLAEEVTKSVKGDETVARIAEQVSRFYGKSGVKKH